MTLSLKLKTPVVSNHTSKSQSLTKSVVVSSFESNKGTHNAKQISSASDLLLLVFLHCGSDLCAESFQSGFLMPDTFEKTFKRLA